MSSSICASCTAQYGCALAITPSSRKRPMSSGMDDLDVGDVRSRVGQAVGAPGGFDGVERLAHGPFADGVEMRLEPERVEPRHVGLERLRVDHAHAAVRRRAAVVVEVRLEDRAGAVLEDAVEHQLDARRGVAADGGPGSPLDELLDLLGAARPGPTTAPRRRGPSTRRDRRASCTRPRLTSGVTLASCQLVMPRAWSSAWASRRPATSSSGVSAGSRPSTRSIAPSWSAPDGRPSASRSIRPSSGSRVSAVDAGQLERLRVDPAPCGRRGSRGRPADPARPDRGRRGAGCRPGSRPSTSRRRGSTAHPGARRRMPR